MRGIANPLHRDGGQGPGDIAEVVGRQFDLDTATSTLAAAYWLLRCAIIIMCSMFAMWKGVLIGSKPNAS